VALTPWTADWLKACYLAGLPTKGPDGNDFAADLYTNAMSKAAAWLSNEANVTIPKTTFTAEAHDFSSSSVGEYWLLQLDHRPVRSVTSLTLQVGNQPVFETPASWIQAPQGVSNILQIVPNPAEMGNWHSAVFGFWSIEQIATWGRMPGWYRATYEAGWDAADMPEDVMDVAAKRAAVNVMNQIGALALGAGIQSSSRSMDGVSQSKTASGYKGQIDELNKQIARDVQVLRRKWTGIGVMVA